MPPKFTDSEPVQDPLNPPKDVEVVAPAPAVELPPLSDPPKVSPRYQIKAQANGFPAETFDATDEGDAVRFYRQKHPQAHKCVVRAVRLEK